MSSELTTAGDREHAGDGGLLTGRGGRKSRSRSGIKGETRSCDLVFPSSSLCYTCSILSISLLVTGALYCSATLIALHLLS